MVSIIIFISWLMFSSSNSECVPTDVCEAYSQRVDGTLYSGATKKICLSNGTVCSYSYSTEDCSDDGVDPYCELRDDYQYQCPSSYMNIRGYYFAEDETDCSSKENYDEYLLPIGCVEADDTFGSSLTNGSVKYQCTDSTFTVTYYEESECSGSVIYTEAETDGVCVTKNNQPQNLYNVLYCGDSSIDSKPSLFMALIGFSVYMLF